MVYRRHPMAQMRITPPNRPRHSFEQNWPPNVWNIGLDRLDYLGVDEKGALYWDGQPIEMKRSIILTGWQKGWAAAVSASAVVGAIAAAFSAYADMVKP